MIFIPTTLPGSYLVELSPKGDKRGWFVRTYCKTEFARIGHTAEWVQHNHSFTAVKGTIRGLHFQKGLHREIKLVRCISGAAYDVIVDLRKGSPTFLKWFGAEISADNSRMMYVPEGFAHGFQALDEGTELIYLHSEYYDAGEEGGVRFNDPALAIVWPVAVTEVSERDNRHPWIDQTFKGL